MHLNVYTISTALNLLKQDWHDLTWEKVAEYFSYLSVKYTQHTRRRSNVKTVFVLNIALVKFVKFVDIYNVATVC